VPRCATSPASGGATAPVTAYLEWLYGDISPSTFGTPLTLTEKLRRRFKPGGPNERRDDHGFGRPAGDHGRLSYGYVSLGETARTFTSPEPYELDDVEAAS